MTPLTITALSNTIKSKAKALGFHACGIARATHLPDDARQLKSWLDRNWHGEMQYMENHFEKRTDPTRLLPGARSVIVVLQNYTPKKEIPEEENFKISKYAYGEDYHFVMKRKLKTLIQWIDGHAPKSHSRAFVDSAPVLERAWAREAGLGWIGKNTCLITKEQGSYFFIGVILTDKALDYDNVRTPNHCGGCTRCLEACPTRALDKNGLDARKCISYLTIEFREESLPEEFAGKMDNWIFGCDICQDVCPWNRLSAPHDQPEFDPSDKLKSLKKKDWQKLDETSFKEVFRHSPIKRTKYPGLLRNIRFASGEQGDTD